MIQVDLYFCNTDALSWKLPETGVESMSGPDSAEVDVDPIEVLVHRGQIEEYISNRKVIATFSIVCCYD